MVYREVSRDKGHLSMPRLRRNQKGATIDCAISNAAGKQVNEPALTPPRIPDLKEADCAALRLVHLEDYLLSLVRREMNRARPHLAHLPRDLPRQDLFGCSGKGGRQLAQIPVARQQRNAARKAGDW